MSIPEVTETVQDFALGIIPQNTDGVNCVMGVCAGGSANTLYSFADTKLLADTLLHGPAVEAAAHKLTVSGGPVIVVPVNASVAGVAGSVTHVGTGAGTVVVGSAPNDNYEAIVVITRDGTLGTGAFKLSLDGGDNFGPETAIPSGGVYTVADAGITLTFSSTFVTADTYSFSCTAPGYSNTDLATAIDALLADTSTEWDHLQVVGTPAPAAGAVTETGTSPTIAVTGTPKGYYDVKIVVTTGGILGTAVVKYSLDGGATYTLGLVSGASVALGTTGLTLTMSAGTYVLNDSYAFNTYGPLPALAAVLSTKMTTAKANHRATYAVMEAGDAPDAILKTAFASFADYRVLVVPGSEELTSSISGRQYRRPAAWPVCARITAVPVSEHLGRVKSGSLPGVGVLYRDEAKTPGLDAARFTTLRTILGRQGKWVTAGRTMAPSGSDYADLQNLRVMNKVCKLSRNAGLTFLNDSVRINKNTGFIDERDARAMESFIQGQVKAGVVDTGDASSVSVTIPRTDNILSTKTIRIKGRLIPLGYAEHIDFELGLYNPALAPPAA